MGSSGLLLKFLVLAGLSLSGSAITPITTPSSNETNEGDLEALASIPNLLTYPSFKSIVPPSHHALDQVVPPSKFKDVFKVLQLLENNANANASHGDLESTASDSDSSIMNMGKRVGGFGRGPIGGGMLGALGNLGGVLGNFFSQSSSHGLSSGFQTGGHVVNRPGDLGDQYYDNIWKNMDAKNSKAYAITKIMFTSGKLFTQMLELKRATTNSIVDTLTKMARFKSAITQNPADIYPLHISKTPVPTASPEFLESLKAQNGWSRSTSAEMDPYATSDVAAHARLMDAQFDSTKRAGSIATETTTQRSASSTKREGETGSGSGWGSGTGTGNSLGRLSYAVGSKLGALSKVLKLVEEGYYFGTDFDSYFKNGLGYINIHDYYDPKKDGRGPGWDGKVKTFYRPNYGDSGKPDPLPYQTYITPSTSIGGSSIPVSVNGLGSGNQNANFHQVGGWGGQGGHNSFSSVGTGWSLPVSGHSSISGSGWTANGQAHQGYQSNPYQFSHDSTAYASAMSSVNGSGKRGKGKKKISSRSRNKPRLQIPEFRPI